MYCTKLWVLLSILLAGCSSAPTTKLTDDFNKNISTPLVKGSAAELKLYQQAITQLNNNQLEVAEKSFIQMTKAQPDLAGPWANLALLYLKKEQMTKAETNIQTALKKNPNMAQALNLAGYIKTQHGEINKAKAFYEKAIKIKSDYALAHYNLALLYDIYLQDISMAIQHYQLYLTFNENKDERTKNWVEELKLNIKDDNA